MNPDAQLFGTVQEAGNALAANPPRFERAEIAWPGFYLRFEGSPERVERVVKYMLAETLAAKAEETSKKRLLSGVKDQTT